ncbi:MAG TPA: RNA methyltransferase [Mycobacteriales bacterium]|nr:RNA methyltransferase [Mycobacteriales bacterium]
MVEGPQALREAIAAGTVVEAFATPGAAVRHAELLRAVPRVHEADERALAALSDTVTPQGVVGVASLVTVPVAEALVGAPRSVAVLCDVSDPGNAGTVLRVADAAGADAVILCGSSVDPHNGKCVRASAGSLWHLPVAVVPSWEDAFRAVRSAGLRVTATSARGTPLPEADLAAPTAWVFGSEAHGLPAPALEAADVVLAVPIAGRAESLNLATAAAICLYAPLLRR